MSTDPYETAPSTLRELSAVLDLAAGFQGWEPDAAEFHELYVRKGALLDRIALKDPADPEAAEVAHDAATTLIAYVDSETRMGDDGEPTAHGWTLPTDAHRADPRTYARTEYARWALDAADVDPERDPRPRGPEPTTTYLVGDEVQGER